MKKLDFPLLRNAFAIALTVFVFNNNGHAQIRERLPDTTKGKAREKVMVPDKTPVMERPNIADTGKGKEKVYVPKNEPAKDPTPLYEVKSRVIPYTIELNQIDPALYDEAQGIWVQSYPMPKDRSEMIVKYTLKNKIISRPGKIKARIGNNQLLGGSQNAIVEFPPNTNFSGQFHCYGLSPGNYTIHFDYIGKGTARLFKPSGEWDYMDTTFAEADFAFTVTTAFADNDADNIYDLTEHQLLERFRPYFMFSDDGGEDDYRPADALRYINLSELRSNTNETDDSHIVLTRDRMQSSLLSVTSPYNSTDITVNKTKTNYYINPLESIDGMESNPGRHGNSWSEELDKRNIGLYGHVVPFHSCAVNYFDFYHVPNSTDEGELYYKIEYWQFFGYNNAHQMEIADHEGDWTSVQLIYCPRTDKIITVFWFAHGLDFRYNLSETIDVRHISNRDGAVDEYRGTNFNPNIDLVFHDLDFETKKGAWENAQNNILRLFQEPGTTEFGHPVVYIENGGHEFYPTDDWDFYYAPSHNGKSYNFLTATPPNLGEVENPLHETVAADFVLKFNGSWGAWSRKNDPPQGPPLHRNWTWPASSSVRYVLGKLSF